MKVWVLRRLALVALKGRLYYTWSRMYRWLWQRRYRTVVIPSFTSVESVAKVVGRMRWRADGWRELWDAISDPRATWRYHVNDLGDEGPANDCDDISMWGVDRLDHGFRRGIIPGVKDAGLLSVPWVNQAGEAGGHNVCAFQWDKELKEKPDWKWYHMSNWHNGEPQGPFVSLEDAARNVLGGRTSLGCAFATTDLKLLRYMRGENL